MKRKKTKKGFSFLELVVACFVILIIGAVSIAMLLSYIKDSQVSAALEEIHNLKTAITSAAVDDVLVDQDGDGDYLDDLVEEGKLDKSLVVIPGATYQVLQSATADGVTIYYLSIECSTDRCREIIEELDKRIDDGDGPTSGSVQWV